MTRSQSSKRSLRSALSLRFASVLFVAAAVALPGAAVAATPRFSDARFASVGTAAPADLVVADLNGDGRQDVVLVHGTLTDVTPTAPQWESVSVLLGDGAGGFAAPLHLRTAMYPSRVAVGDLNGDGHPDLLLAGGDVPPGPTAASRQDQLLPMLGNGAGGFEPLPGAPYTVPGSNPSAIALADVDNDGHLDAATHSFFSVPSTAVGVPQILIDPGTVEVLRGDGSGALGSPNIVATSTGAIGLAVTDVDRDGRPDLVFPVNSSSGVALAVARNLGGGAFATPAVSAATTPILTFASIDATGDGSPTLLTTHASLPRTAVIWNPVAGVALSQTATFPLGDWGSLIGEVDLDRDGRVDLVGSLATASGAGATLLRGAGNGVFGAPERLALTGILRPRALADMNGDGAPDLVGAEYGGPPGQQSVAAVSVALSLPTLQAAGADFGAQAVGASSDRQLVVTNAGAAPLRVVAPALGGPDAADFQIEADACSGRAVGPDASCALTLRFRPEAAGPRTASLRVGANDEAPVHELALTGLGTAAPTPGPAEIPTARAGCATRPTDSGTRLRCGLVLGPGATVSRVAVRLVRGGRVRALADARSGGRLVLRARYPLIAGRYTLVAVVVVADGRTRQTRREVVIGPRS